MWFEHPEDIGHQCGDELSDYVPAKIISGEAGGFGECAVPWPEECGHGVTVSMGTR